MPAVSWTERRAVRSALRRVQGQTRALHERERVDRLGPVSTHFVCIVGVTELLVVNSERGLKLCHECTPPG